MRKFSKKGCKGSKKSSNDVHIYNNMRDNPKKRDKGQWPRRNKKPRRFDERKDNRNTQFETNEK